MFRLIFTLTIMVGLLTAGGCAQTPELCVGCSNPWVSSNKNSVFQPPQLPGYDAYAKAKHEILQKAKYFPEWIEAAERKSSIDSVSPKRHMPDIESCSGQSRRGIILVHGLFDTPFIMRDLARHFNKRCFIVFDALLTGHGTRPGDLLKVSREQWKREIEYVVKAVKGEVKAGKFDELYIGGYSLGGALSLYAAAEFESIKAVLLFAPALIPTYKLAYGSIPVSIFEGEYFKLFGEYDYAKYESLPHRAGSETYKLGLEVEKYLKRGFAKPLFIAVSLEDDTIDAIHTIKSVQATAQNQMLIFAANDDEVLPLCHDYQQRNGPATCHVVSSTLEKSGINSLSHIGLVVAPDNEHYGESGDYRNCLYTKSQMRLCLVSEINQTSCDKNIICYGEAILATETPVIRRITFNPNFDKLTDGIDDFLKTLEK